MVGCCVLPLRCGVSGVFFTLGSYAGGVGSSCGMSVLKMFNGCFSDAVFYPSCGMGLGGAGFCRSSVRSHAACVTSSSRKVLVIYSALVRSLSCQRLVPMLYWVCEM